jgi:glycosyltransferase involved in cell wall biosynthesis
MKILTFLHSFEPGGVERIALRLVREWRASGYDAPLFMGRTDGAMRDDVGVDLVYHSPRQPRIGSGWWETIWMIVTLPGFIRRTRPDALFCAGNTYVVVAVAMKLLLGRACPRIVAKISNDLDRADQPRAGRMGYRLWLRFQGMFIDRAVAMAEPMVGEIAEYLRIARTRIDIVPDPALSDAMIRDLRKKCARTPAVTQGRRFLAVGRLVPQKNVALMLRAFQRGAQAGDHLTIVGDGPERPKLEILAARLGVDQAVTFTGYVADPTSLFSHFDALLLSSNYEGVPAVVLEALAANLTVIATDCSRSMATLLADGRLGLLVPPGDTAALAAAISAEWPPRNEQLSLDQARRFTIERSAELYAASFQRATRSASATTLAPTGTAPTIA